MTEMTTSTVESINGIDVVFKELSVAQIRRWMTEERDPDSLGDGFFSDLRISDLLTFTNLTAEQIEDLRPSHLRVAIGYCKRQNPDFFAWLDRLNSRLAKP